MPETKAKIKLQDTSHLNIYMAIQKLKHLEWSKNEHLTKTSYSLELFLKNTTKYLRGT